MYLFKIFALVKHYNKLIIINWVISIFAAVFTVLSVATIQPALRIILGTGEKVTSPPNYEKISQVMEYGEKYILYLSSLLIEKYGGSSSLFYVGIFIVMMFFFKNIFIYLSGFILSIVGNGIIYDLRKMMYDKILSLPVKFFSNKRKGDIMSRITNDISEVQRTTLNSLQIFMLEPVVIIGTLFALIMMSWELTLFVFILLPISGSIISIIGKKLKARSKNASEDQGRIFSNIEETINGLKIIKIFNSEKKAGKYFMESIFNFRRNMTKLEQRQKLGSPFSEFLGSCIMMSILIYGGNMVVKGNSLSPQSFLVYLGMFFQIIQPVKKISSAFYEIQRGKGPADRIFEILNTVSTIKEIKNPLKIKNVKKGIEFKNVSFFYEKGKNVIHNISFKISKGKTTAFVGVSGSGKSTITNLITRFYDIEKGEILLDNKNIKDYKLEDLRGIYGMVSQENILFNDTIYNNIALGVENATMEKVIDASKIANAHKFIEKLENGYNENIGDGGGKLSGGQKQRISIARAILKKPEIMILDEATSALDAESEKLVQNALNKIMETQTSIVIAHRLSTIKNADEIIVLQEGKILEQGTHKELIEKKGSYNKLVELQTFS